MSANYIQSRSNKPKTGKNLVLARSRLFYGLEYYQVKEEKNSINRGITSTPNFLFYAANTKVIIDFSDFKNVISKQEIESFWKLVHDGMTFGIENGGLYNQSTSKSYDVSGTYVFRKIENLTIHADVTTVKSLSSIINLYSKTEFENTPSFEFSLIIAPPILQKKTRIYNKLGSNSRNSFTFFGASIGDYIQFQNYDIRYPIIEIQIDSEGKEIITIEGLLNDEDRTATKTFVALYIEKKNLKDIKINSSDEVVGSCTALTNGLTVSCFKNQTESQCLCRLNDGEDALFVAKGSCIDPTSTDQTVPTSTDLLTDIAQNLVNIIDKKQTRFNSSVNIGSISSFNSPLTASSNRIF